MGFGFGYLVPVFAPQSGSAMDFNPGIRQAHGERQRSQQLKYIGALH